MFCNKRRHHNEKPTLQQRVAPLAAPRKPTGSNKDPVSATEKKYFFKKAAGRRTAMAGVWKPNTKYLMLLHAESDLWQKDCWQGEGGQLRGMLPASDGGWAHGGREGPDQTNCITRNITAGRTCKSQAWIAASAPAVSHLLHRKRGLGFCLLRGQWGYQTRCQNEPDKWILPPKQGKGP